MQRLARLDDRPPRRRRSQWLAGPVVFHHVIIRGIERRKIVRNKKDREDFLERLADICKAGALVRMWRALLS